MSERDSHRQTDINRDAHTERLRERERACVTLHGDTGVMLVHNKHIC